MIFVAICSLRKVVMRWNLGDDGRCKIRGGKNPPLKFFFKAKEKCY
jgi:hypothetical protein